jgi:hypothetical protein
MSTADASLLIGCSTESVRTMRRYFENPDEFLTLTERRNERERRARSAKKQEFEPEQEFDASPWFDLIQTAAIAFDTDTEYSVAIAEDYRALQSGWSLKVKAHERCHECAYKATTLRGYCQKHSKKKK